MKWTRVWRSWRGLPASACLAVVLAMVWVIIGPRPQKAVASHRDHRTPRPLLTGTDGSETGLADFLGNFTTITSPSQSYFLMERQPDCSLTLYTGQPSSASQPEVTATMAHYERTLHQQAGLSTTGGVYTDGCTELNTGISSRPVLSLGRLSNGVGLFAAARGMGTGTVAANFSSFTYTPHRSAPFVSKINAGDFNGDGLADLVAVNGAYGNTSPSISILLGNADGTFADPVSYVTTGTEAAAAVVDDVNGDGRLDVVVVSADQQFSVLLGNGDGTLRTAQNFSAPAAPGQTSAAAAPIINLITADLRGSHKKDIICSNGLVLLGNGDGTFTTATTAAFPYAPDNLSADGANLTSGDLNNDGKPDLVVGSNGSVTTWIGNGDGTFATGVAYDAINNTGYVTVSDLDGDGNADIYIGLANGGTYSVDFDNPGQSYVLMGNGDGTFQGAPQIQGQYNGANVGDVNGDGLPDIITNTMPEFSTVPAFTVQLGTTAGPFRQVSTVTAPASFSFGGAAITGADTHAADTFAVSDLNGDGKADLVWADDDLNGTTGAQTALPVYFVALSNGDGTFAAPTPYAFPQIAPAGNFDNMLTVASLQVGHFTSSGHNDLLFTYTDQIGGTNVANPYTGGLLVLPGNGDGTFGAAVVTITSSSSSPATTLDLPQIHATTDLTGDGKADLLVTLLTSSGNTGFTNALQFFGGNGDGTFQPPATVSTAANPGIGGTAVTPLVLSDFNKDGKLDLACVGETSAGDAQLAISLGNGDGTFAAPTIWNLPGGDTIRGAPIAAADFNGDGKIDLALIDGEAFSGIFYGNGDGTFSSVNIGNGGIVPKDLINLFNFGGGAIVADFNLDGHPDLLAGNTIFLNIYAAPPPASTPVATTTALTASASAINAGASVTFTATVTGAFGSTGTPTGTVTFLEGTTTLGTGALNSSGVATYSNTTLATGAHSITASYGGDSNFTVSTSSAVTVNVVAGIPPSFTIAANPATLSVTAGQSSGPVTITVTPAGGFAQAVTFACSGLPSKAACTFAPATVTPGTGPATTIATISTTAAVTSVQRAGLVLVAGLLLLLMSAGKGRRGYALFPVVLLSGWLLGCGGAGSTSSNVASGGGGGSGGTTTTPGTPSGTSTVTVTATSPSLTQTTTIQLTVP